MTIHFIKYTDVKLLPTVLNNVLNTTVIFLSKSSYNRGRTYLFNCEKKKINIHT